MKQIPARFYALPSGREPVRDWLKGNELTAQDRKIIGEDVQTVEFGWPLGMPLCRQLAPGLHEVRCTLTSNRIARILFCIHEGNMVLLHGFIKKTQKTPDADKQLALKRMKEVIKA
ncbi:MAG: type II toxin-antitoxin system RelE/ParE family toxin [Cyanothece sp. SIO1E1]|nr:type II toxin-antitoxin system RelE/ParE family toxin [Cyanothece sp. SIO1E1]